MLNQLMFVLLRAVQYWVLAKWDDVDDMDLINNWLTLHNTSFTKELSFASLFL